MINCWNSEGRLVFRLINTARPRAITEKDKQLYDDSYLAANKGAPPSAITSIKEQNRLARYADHAPAFSRFLLSSNGDIWVSDFVPEHFIIGPSAVRAPHSPTAWHVLTQAGAWLSDIALPARFVLYDVGPDFVSGVRFDDDDIEQVVVFRIRK